MDSSDIDPLVHGWQPGRVTVSYHSGEYDGHGPNPHAPAPDDLPGEEISPADRAPWLDLWELIFRPRTFFKRLVPFDPVPRRLIAKAAVVYVMLSWIGGYISGLYWTQADLQQMADSLWQLITKIRHSPLALRVPTEGLSRELIYEQVMTWGLVARQVSVFVAPIFGLVGLLLTSAVATSLLARGREDRPDTAKRPLFALIFTAQLFVGWSAILLAIPYAGGFLAWAVTLVLGVLALQWIYGVSTLRAFFALKIVNIVLFMVTTIAVILAVLAFAAAFATTG